MSTDTPTPPRVEPGQRAFEAFMKGYWDAASEYEMINEPWEEVRKWDRAGWAAVEAALAAAPPPTSGEVGEMVERLKAFAACKGGMTIPELRQAADLLARVAEERDEAVRKLKAWEDEEAHEMAQWFDRATAAEAALSDVSAAIGTVEFMDPPDGGDVSLAEQVRRMRAALEKAREAMRERCAECIERDCHDDMTREEEAAAIRKLEPAP